MTIELYQIINWVVTLLVAVIVPGIIFHARRIGSAHTKIQVLEAQFILLKDGHDTEMRQIRDSFRQITEKLNQIESHLRQQGANK